MRLHALLAVPLAALLGLGLAGPASAASPLSRLRVGTVTLHRCDVGVAAWCGSVRVPLDYTDAGAGTIRIGFGWIPGEDARGTVVAQEGGPGYPSTGTASDYVAMLGALSGHRNLLVVDARGTGRSAAIDCEPLQSLPAPSPRFAAAVADCGDQLNHTYRRTDGSWVHASDLFTTANSAHDLARVLEALDLGEVDLYGDSYGTYFAQSFLARFPRMLRSVVLDSAYEARDLDPWYRTTVTTARAAFDKVCRRAHCARGSSWQRIARLARSLRAQPISGRVVGTDAQLHHVTVDITALVNLVNDAGYDTDPYRQLDAATRAYLGHADVTPLLRLYAQDVGYDYSDYYARASYFSDGLYLAVACSDYPQLFDMHSSTAQRRRQLARSIAALAADTFAPFTTREWLSVLPYTEAYTGCLNWPAPTHPPDSPVPPGAAMDATGVPVLVLNGELDSLTPAAGGAHIARQIGSAAHAYVAANNVHLVALDNAYPCGSRVVQHFLARPTRTPDTSCLKLVPAIPAVASFPATLDEATPVSGTVSPFWQRRLASVAVAAAQDAVIRFDYVDGYRDLGLRGGSVRYDHHGTAMLHDVRWTSDTKTTGTARRTRTGGVGTVTVASAAHVATFHVRWSA